MWDSSIVIRLPLSDGIAQMHSLKRLIKQIGLNTSMENVNPPNPK
jgi:hypothetical protein